jgi:DNA-binding CsgD family transcriptional regulator
MTIEKQRSTRSDDVCRLLEACCHARSPRAFVETLIRWCVREYGYDQALALFYDASGIIVAFHTLGTRSGWLESYLEYYFEYLDESSAGHVAGAETIWEYPAEEPYLRIDAIDWSSATNSLFKRNYIDAVGLRSTLTFNLSDMDNRYRAAICLDRRGRRSSETAAEREVLCQALPVLNSMYRNFLYDEDENADDAALWEEYGLTAREAQIADLLCRGLRTTAISKLLFISPETVRKHIAHTYRKVGVSSQSELIVCAATRHTFH